MENERYYRYRDRTITTGKHRAPFNYFKVVATEDISNMVISIKKEFPNSQDSDVYELQEVDKKEYQGHLEFLAIQQNPEESKPLKN